MPSVPGIEVEDLIDSESAHFRMDERPAEAFLVERPKEMDPARVERIEQLKRWGESRHAAPDTVEEGRELTEDEEEQLSALGYL